MQFYIEKWLSSHGQACGFYATIYNKKHGEVDFLIEYKNHLLPIEVKSGKDYQTHSALTYFMSDKYFQSAIVLSNYNVKVDQNILYLPIYMTMFLQKEERIGPVKKIDLSKLSLS